VSYVAAGYAICLGVLCLYAASLVARRRRLERASAVEEVGGGPVADRGSPAAAGTVGAPAGGPAGAPGPHRPAPGVDGTR
jgi:hypothetical protein